MNQATKLTRVILPLAMGAAALLAGCVTLPGSKTEDTQAKPAASATPAATATPAAPASAKVGPGMNDRGEVVDSSKVETGFGKKVKGLNDWEGEITGKPAASSKFTRLQIGMGLKQVMDIAGTPTDQGAYMTGKAWIPWYFGADKHRHELVYKGQGRLIFASPGGFDFSSGNLIWIIHNASEPGYR